MRGNILGVGLVSESNTRVYGSDGIRNLEILNGVGIQGFKFGGLLV